MRLPSAVRLVCQFGICHPIRRSVAVTALGHAHPEIAAVIAEQAGLLLHEEPLPFFGLEPLNLVTLACPHLGPTLVCPLSGGRRDRFLGLALRPARGATHDKFVA